jgi:IstB-like ATP binding protein
MLFEVFSQRYERSSTLVTSNLPFAEWTEVLGSERLTGFEPATSSLGSWATLSHQQHKPQVFGSGASKPLCFLR